MKIIHLPLALLLASCASIPSQSLPTLQASLGSVSVRYTSLKEANEECERRIGDGRPHWGCATFRKDNRSCDIIVGDVDRSSVLGKELNNCVEMALNLPKGKS